jgi:hypothetical protein
MSPAADIGIIGGRRRLGSPDLKPIGTEQFREADFEHVEPGLGQLREAGKLLGQLREADFDLVGA